MNLPSSSQLNTRTLARIFDNKSESYKLFWFKAILKNVGEGRAEMSYGNLIDQMIIDAWYMVSEFHLNLGPADTLEKIVLRLAEISGLMPSEKPEIIKDYLAECSDAEILRMKRILTLNVPYRLQAPFMPEANSDFWKQSPDATVDYINRKTGMIYTIYRARGLESTIRIHEEWVDYISENYGILLGWTDFNLINYLQGRNPTVPGIASKLYPPQVRKLNNVIKYWRGISEIHPIIDIYDGAVLGSREITIDHFVPWSYVASDELWNLIPTSRSINSSKSNNLPRWDAYFDKLCRAEYDAYKLTQENKNIKGLFERCARENLNSEEVRQRLYRPGLDRTEFSGQLSEIMMPVYESARNMGFGEWEFR